MQWRCEWSKKIANQGERTHGQSRFDQSCGKSDVAGRGVLGTTKANAWNPNPSGIQIRGGIETRSYRNEVQQVPENIGRAAVASRTRTETQAGAGRCSQGESLTRNRLGSATTANHDEDGTEPEARSGFLDRFADAGGFIEGTRWMRTTKSSEGIAARMTLFPDLFCMTHARTCRDARIGRHRHGHPHYQERMEACIACERQDSLDLTDDGGCHWTCDSGGGLFDTHWNLQKRLWIQTQKRSREKTT